MHHAKAHNLLKWVFGLMPIIVGVDKLFFSAIAVWESYASSIMTSLVPFDLGIFFMIIGVVEIIVGVLVLTKWTQIGAYLLTLWFILVGINLVLIGAYDIALRDAALAGATLALAWLSK